MKLIVLILSSTCSLLNAADDRCRFSLDSNARIVMICPGGDEYIIRDTRDRVELFYKVCWTTPPKGDIACSPVMDFDKALKVRALIKSGSWIQELNNAKLY